MVHPVLQITHLKDRSVLIATGEPVQFVIIVPSNQLLRSTLLTGRHANQNAQQQMLFAFIALGVNVRLIGVGLKALSGWSC